MQRLCVTCRRPVRAVRDSHDRIVWLDAKPDEERGNVLLVEQGDEEDLYHRRAGQPVVLSDGAALTERGLGRELYAIHMERHGCEAVAPPRRRAPYGRR